MFKKLKAGGYRLGAGRPKGTGKYQESTYPMRVPISLLSKIESLIAEMCCAESVKDNITFYKRPPQTSIPFFAAKVAAGFPTYADDHIENHLDLNQYLIQKPSATFFVRVEGDSMLGVGIHQNDILIVDRSIRPTPNKIIIASVNGELTVKRLEADKKGLRLIPENPKYQPIAITEDTEFTILGVVVHVIHSL